MQERVHLRYLLTLMLAASAKPNKEWSVKTHCRRVGGGRMGEERGGGKGLKFEKVLIAMMRIHFAEREWWGVASKVKASASTPTRRKTTKALAVLGQRCPVLGQ